MASLLVAVVFLVGYSGSALAQTTLPAPELVAPANMDTIQVEVVQTESVTLDWNAVTGAATYEVQVFNDESEVGGEPIPFKARVLSDSEVLLDQVELLNQLATDADSTFFWRVRGRNAADREGAWSEVWRFTIGTPGNLPPEITGPELTEEDRTIDEETELTFTVTAVDPEGGVLTYTLDEASVALGMAIDAATGAFTWTPTEAQGPGEYPVTFTVTDDGTPPASADTSFTIFVNEVNLPPELAEIGNQGTDVGVELAFTATATDPDIPENTLTFSLEDADDPAMAIDPATGEFTWTPTAEGMFMVTIVVSDDGDPASTDSETITISVPGNMPPEITGPDLTEEDRTIDEETELTFTVTAVDPEGGVLTYTLDEASVALGMAIDAATGAFTWTPTEAQGPGEYPVTFTVTDDGTPPASADTSFTIFVNEVNLPPELAEIGNQGTDVGVELAFTATATDPDIPENTLTFSLEDADDPAMAIDPATGEFTWTPTAEGMFMVTIVVSDDGDPASTDSETITISVPGNMPPEITGPELTEEDRTIDEETELTFTVTAVDPEGGVLTYTLDEASVALGMAIDAATGAFTWTPTEAQGPGEYPVTFTVTDDGAPPASADTSFTIFVNEVNLPPELAEIGNQGTDVGVELAFTATATDPDIPENTLTFSLEDADDPAMAIDPATGEFTWTPTAEGMFMVTIVVSDDGDPASTDSETITISVPGNMPPEITGPELTEEDRTIDEETELTFTVTAVDPEGGVLTYALDEASVALGMAIDAATGAFTWTPTEAQGPGEYPVTFTVTDDGTPPASADTSFTIFVNEVNLPPELAEIGNQGTDVGVELAFTATATDPDIPENTLTFSLEDADDPAMAIDPATGEFTWTPTVGGMFMVTVVVSDDGDPVATDSETITISVPDLPNRPPEIEDPGLTAEDRTIDEENLLTFTISATDPDGDTVSYSLDSTSVAQGMMIDTATGVYAWTPTEEQGPGEYPVTFIATDDGMPQAQDDTTFTVLVNEVNLPPVLVAPEAASAAVNETVTFTATATDPDIPANNLEFSLANATPGMAIDPTTGVFTWTSATAGAYVVDVIVTDNGAPALSDSATVSIVIVPLPFCSASIEFPITVEPGAADAYVFEISLDENFTNPIVIRTDVVGGQDTNISVPLDGLDTDTEYFWRVFTEVDGQRFGTSFAQKLILWPSTISVSHTLPFTRATESADFRMISVPGQSQQIAISTTFPNQSPDVDWRIFRDDTENVAYPAYLEKMDPNASDPNFAFQPGRGFWAISTSMWQVPQREIPSAQLEEETNRFFQIPLAVGNSQAEARWSMIGNPFDFPMAWEDVKAANQIVNDEVLWDWTGQQYVPADSMIPYKGYYYFNRDNNRDIVADCFLQSEQSASKNVAPAAAIAKAPEAEEDAEPVVQSQGDLVLTLHRTHTDNEPMSTVEIGWSDEAEDGLDKGDRYMPPAFFETYRITLVNDDLVTRYPYLQREMRSSALESQVFDIELKSEPGEVSYLRVDGLESLMHREVYVFDDMLGVAHNLHETPMVRLEPDQEVNRFRLLVGDSDFIAEQEEQLLPEGFRIQQSYPNPFTDRTTIEYALPESEHVRIEVVNILGQRVKTLINSRQEAGFNRVMWDGTNDAGEAVASGMYIYIFSSDSYQASKRVVRIR